MAQTVAKYATGQPLGPGDHLHLAIFRWVGEGPTRMCGCQDRIAKMNAWGPEGCRKRLDEIVGWMEGEAKKPRPIYKSIKQEDGTEKQEIVGHNNWWRYAVAVPGSRYFIKRMVLGAIKKAEAQKLSSNVPSQQLPISSAVRLDGNAGRNTSGNPNL